MFLLFPLGFPLAFSSELIQLYDRINTLLARQNAERLAAGTFWTDLDLIFPTPTGAPLRASTVTDYSFKPLLERAGLPRSTRFHDLRHTCATLLLSRGVDVVSVQRLLGHASAAMTLNVYGHLMPGMGEATAAAMSAALS